MVTKNSWGEEYDAGIINQNLRHYKELKNMLEKTKKDKQKVIQHDREYYSEIEEKITRRINEVKSQFGDYLTRFGMTSASVPSGNVHFVTTKDSLKWGSATNQKRIMKQLPSELIKQQPTIDKDAIKKSVTVTPEGKVILNDTGEIIEGLTGTKGGSKEVAIRIDK